MKISSELCEKIQRTIDEFAADSVNFLVTGDESGEKSNLRKIACEINVLPIKFDWFASRGIQPSGEIILFTYDKPYKIKVETNQKIINMVLFRTAQRYSELRKLLPVRNAESITCPGCDGSGILKEFAKDALLSKSINCNCGGVGWLPSAHKKHLYF